MQHNYINQNCIHGNVILFGDFNITLSSIDRTSWNTDRTSFHLQKLLDKYNIKDSYRTLYTLKNQFLYNNKSHTIGSRIDYIFLSEYTINNLKSVNMRNVPKIPDQKAVTSIIKTNEVHGKGYFKLNTKWLSNNIYIKGTKHMIATHKTVWAFMKYSKQSWDTLKLKNQRILNIFCNILNETAKYWSE